MNTKLLAVAGIVITILIGIDATYSRSTYVSSGTLVTDDNAILIQDQKPANDTVVTYAKLAQPGYVVLYAPQADGAKTVVGESDLLPAGEHRNVRVHHHHGSSVKSGTGVSAAIVADDGDGIFSPESDTDVLVPDTGDSATAVITDDAALDTDLSDEELGDLLVDGGYDVDESSAADAPAPDTDEAAGEESAAPEGAETVAPEASNETSADMDAPEDGAVSATTTDASGNDAQ